MKSVIRVTACLSAAVLLFGTVFVSADNAVANNGVSDSETVSINTADTYKSYKNNFADLTGGETVVSDFSNASNLNNAVLDENVLETGKSGVIISDNGSATWTFYVPENALYNISVDYMAAEQGSGDIEMGFLLDGKVPFNEVEYISFNRSYEQPLKEFLKNASGNEIKPTLNEILVWSSAEISDISGYISEPFLFCLTKGTHTVTLSGSRGKIAVGTISFTAEKTDVSYKEYKAANKKESENKGASNIILEGEKFDYSNTVVTTPETDRTSPITSPQSVETTVLNTVGGENWKMIGDSITWKFKAEKSGFYNINIRARQNLADGRYTTRKLYLDGKVPFSEANKINFYYNGGWQAVTLGNGNENYDFYLTEGEHTITLEAVAGDISSNVGEIQNLLNEFYRIYRRIVMITGTSPDKQRDYSFETLIPNEIKQLGEYAGKFNDIIEKIDKEAGKNGSYTSVLKKAALSAETMSKKSENIAKNLEQFKSNLAAVSSWTLTAVEQPLEIDLIEISPKGNEKTIKANAGFFKGLSFGFKSFLVSFTQDYSNVGSANKKAKTVEVWIQTGRDQAEVIRELVDTDYAEKFDSEVKLSVVTGGLLQSVLAGKAPDVVFDLAAADPLEYALRGAAYDLTNFDDYEQVASRFSPAAVKAASFEGGVYAMPQTFSFFMLFYRTDIFEEYSLSVPKTWDDVVTMIHTLQSNNLDFGLPKGITTYATLLSQRGGTIYRDGGKKSNFDSNLSVSTFVDYTDFYSLYDLSVTYDFSNRFRSGEMPCAIADFSSYNQLTAFAPEIKGRWRMVPIPGTFDEKGNYNNTSVGTATYMMLLSSSDVKDEAWQFMKWFTSEDVQGIYGIKMESILGSCAKVATANVNALSKMTWSSDEYTNLFKQYEAVDAIPQVPGGYYLARTFDFAFNRVYNGSTLQNMGEDPASVLTEYVPELNEEIARKRAEFGR